MHFNAVIMLTHNLLVLAGNFALLLYVSNSDISVFLKFYILL